jgi:multidrug transporter EmrE-like cation transporter
VIYLLGAILSNSVFGQSYKYAVVRSCRVGWVCLLSFCASALLVLLAGGASGAGVGCVTLALGAGLGMASSLAQLTFFRALRHGPLSTSYAIVALSTLIPTIVSILFWNEQPTVLQSLAVVVAMAAIAMMQEFDLRGGPQPWAWGGWVGLSFLASGMTGVFMKMFTALCPDAHRGMFLLVSYVVSGATTVPLVVRSCPTRREAAVGVLRGSAILAANMLLLRALTVLPGYLVFSCYGAAIIAVNVLAAVLVWRERPRRRAVPGMVLAAAAIALLNV